MIDENTLAKVICRANLEKTLDELKIDLKMNHPVEAAVTIAIERDIAQKWRRFLPEARAVLKAIEG